MDDEKRRVDPQPVLGPLTAHAVFLVVRVESGGERAVRALLEGLSDLRKSVGFRAPEAGLALVVGIGSGAWDRLFAGPRPRELHEFRELNGERHHAPATEGDLLFHIRAAREDLCYELARQIMINLAGAATVVDEVRGFRYFDNRDLLNFVDGSANPEGDDAAESVRVSADDPEFVGASYVIVQKYLHDLTSWETETVAEQERVIGRTKLDDIELPDEVKPANSHVALNTIEDPDGTQHEIVRYNMAFYNFESEEFGTYFIGYASTPDVIEQMLRNMFLGRAPATHDRILDFSTAVTGSLFFVPTADFLDSLPPAPADAAPEAAPVPSDGRPDGGIGGSLRIGSLKRSSDEPASAE